MKDNICKFCNEKITSRRKNLCDICYGKKWRLENPERVKILGKEWRNKNKNKLKEKNRLYFSTPNGFYANMKYRSKSRKMTICNKKSFIKWWNKQEQKCIYCNRTFDEVKNDKISKTTNRFSVDRIDNDKGYLLKNMAICCKRCNTIKGDYFTKEEMLVIGNIIFKKNN